MYAYFIKFEKFWLLLGRPVEKQLNHLDKTFKKCGHDKTITKCGQVAVSASFNYGIENKYHWFSAQFRGEFFLTKDTEGLAVQLMDSSLHLNECLEEYKKIASVAFHKLTVGHLSVVTK